MPNVISCLFGWNGLDRTAAGVLGAGQRLAKQAGGKHCVLLVGTAPEALLAELSHLPGSHPRKVKIARMVWEQTAVPQIWIAQRLQMASAANVSQQLRRQRTVNRCWLTLD